MPLSVKLTIVPVAMASEQIEAMQRRSDLPAGVVIEQPSVTTVSNQSRDRNSDTVCVVCSNETEAATEVESASVTNDSIHDVSDLPAVEGRTEIVPPQKQTQDEEHEQQPPKQQEQEQEQKQQDEVDAESILDLKVGNSSLKSFGSGTNSVSPEKPIEDDFFAITIESTGKYSRKADLDDIARFAKLETVDSEKLKEWLKSYMEQNTPDQLLKPNSIPRSAHVKDDLKKGFEAFKTYGWKTIKLNLQPGLVDVKDQWTKEIVLEQFQLDYSTDLEKALLEKGDMEVVSYLRKGPIAGHPVAAGLFQKGKKSEESQIVTEFRGVDSVVFRLGNNQCAASEIWCGGIQKSCGHY